MSMLFCEVRNTVSKFMNGNLISSQAFLLRLGYLGHVETDQNWNCDMVPMGVPKAMPGSDRGGGGIHFDRINV